MHIYSFQENRFFCLFFFFFFGQEVQRPKHTFFMRVKQGGGGEGEGERNDSLKFPPKASHASKKTPLPPGCVAVAFMVADKGELFVANIPVLPASVSDWSPLCLVYRMSASLPVYYLKDVVSA